MCVCVFFKGPSACHIHVTSSSDSGVVEIKPGAKEEVVTAAVLLFYILKNANLSCVLFTGLIRHTYTKIKCRSCLTSSRVRHVIGLLLQEIKNYGFGVYSVGVIFIQGFVKTCQLIKKSKWGTQHGDHINLRPFPFC